jgi:hypothetical protein
MTIQNLVHSWSSGSSIAREMGLSNSICIHDSGPTSDTTSLWPIANHAIEVCNAWNMNHGANVCTNMIGCRKDLCSFHSSLAKVHWISAKLEQTIDFVPLVLVDNICIVQMYNAIKWSRMMRVMK